MLPDPPKISAEDMRKCRETGDYSPVLFDCYKYVAGLCFIFANLLQDSPVVRKDIARRDYGILIGLINRFARIMLANVALSHKGDFGESTSILDRCIFESCVVLSWLCKSTAKDKFGRYIASGLKTEIEVRNQIQKKIDDRRGIKLTIDKRMLRSVEECLSEAGFDENKIMSTKGLPDLASMLNCLGHQRFSYTVGQRISSHHVHGTWVGLRYHYIELDKNGVYHTKQSSSTHVNQYVYISFVVLDALSYFVDFVFSSNEEEKKEILQIFQDTADEISEINMEIIGNDFDESKPEF